jgi:hypothetical protein
LFSFSAGPTTYPFDPFASPSSHRLFPLTTKCRCQPSRLPPLPLVRRKIKPRPGLFLFHLFPLTASILLPKPMILLRTTTSHH